MKKLIATLILSVAALSASALGGCGNGQTYGGEKAEKRMEQTQTTEKNSGSCKNKDSKNCKQQPEMTENMMQDIQNMGEKAKDMLDMKGKKVKPDMKKPRFKPDEKQNKSNSSMPIAPVNPNNN